MSLWNQLSTPSDFWKTTSLFALFLIIASVPYASLGEGRYCGTKTLLPISREGEHTLRLIYN